MTRTTHIKPAPATWEEIVLQLDIPGFFLLLGSIEAAEASHDLGQCSMVLYVMFYLPIYFQSIHGKTAIMSDADTLPFLTCFSLGAVMGGGLVGKTHHLMSFQLISALIMVAGMALFYTMGVETSQARYLGPQVLCGFGLGLGNKIPMTAVQGFSKPEDVASSTGIMLTQCLFANRMLQTLESSNSNINTSLALGTGAAEIQHVFTDEELKAVTNAYMLRIKDVFASGLAGAAAAVLLTLLIPQKQRPDHQEKKTEESRIA
ncbi:Major facilitator superfamily domain general substrate transporter [Penicillium angulare]|uniref:Major facilitator superfamily domain general substrate transporter n=1 Tax=Penicillium angulare TaxID=116970 RepID=UPI00253F7BC4|nr:Major facilitator superfamily domain general substrate transporter [Penicillium angulare]KAJ5291190.1 Major facilitator superfamily domain general substrate transporter [Penicillium angulare]